MPILIQLAGLMAGFAVVLLTFLAVSYRLAMTELDRRAADFDTYQPVCNGEQHEH
jgi:hypothetical protein